MIDLLPALPVGIHRGMPTEVWTEDDERLYWLEEDAQRDADEEAQNDG